MWFGLIFQISLEISFRSFFSSPGANTIKPALKSIPDFFIF